MGQYPLLPLPAPKRGDPPTGRRGFPQNKVPSLSPKRQTQRLGPVFRRLADVFTEGRDDVALRNDPSSIAPERVLVLEVAGSLVDFQAVARHVRGLEFLGDEEIMFDPDEDFSVPDTRRGREGQR